VELLRLLLQLVEAALGIKIDGILGDLALQVVCISACRDARGVAHSMQSSNSARETYDVEALLDGLRCLRSIVSMTPHEHVRAFHTRITVFVRPFQLIAGYGNIYAGVGCSVTVRSAWKWVDKEQRAAVWAMSRRRLAAARFFEAWVAMEAMTCDKWLRGQRRSHYAASGRTALRSA
jgi:hypothetical protein